VVDVVVEVVVDVDVVVVGLVVVVVGLVVVVVGLVVVVVVGCPRAWRAPGSTALAADVDAAGLGTSRMELQRTVPGAADPQTC